MGDSNKHWKETIGTGVASYTASDVFSSDYTNYCVIINSVDGSALDQWLRLTFGATVTAYYATAYYDNANGISTGTVRINNGAYIRAGLTGTSDDTCAVFDIFAPNLAKRTQVNGRFNNTAHSCWFGGTLANTTAYTAFTLTPDSGTLTGGTVRVYGYRD